jgi:hypothetical protein
VIDDVSMRLSCRGGDAGGVTGNPPGEHTGRCLLGTATGVPRDDVLSDRCCGGVEDREGMGIALATAAAMVASDTSDVGEARNVSTRKHQSIWQDGSSRSSNRLIGAEYPFPIKTAQWLRSGVERVQRAGCHAGCEECERCRRAIEKIWRPKMSVLRLDDTGDAWLNVWMSY